MNKHGWEDNLLELIRRTSTDLPSDVESALRRAMTAQPRGSHGRMALEQILQNVALARQKNVPICQDTGTPIFFCSVPLGFDTNAFIACARAAVAKATRRGYLRQNAVGAVCAAMFETNVAPGLPVFKFSQCARKNADIRLLMKGGGSENVGRQYTLPDTSLHAERDLDGVRRCILDAVWQAQGNGCPPGILGVCVGGDRSTGYEHSKEMFLRKIGERSPVSELAAFETRTLREVEELGIGPMGYGGPRTLLDLKVGELARVPASFFVSISYMCWAFRRRGAVFGPEGGIHRWLY